MAGRLLRAYKRVDDFARRNESKEMRQAAREELAKPFDWPRFGMFVALANSVVVVGALYVSLVLDDSTWSYAFRNAFVSLAIINGVGGPFVGFYALVVELQRRTDRLDGPPPAEPVAEREPAPPFLRFLFRLAVAIVLLTTALVVSASARDGVDGMFDRVIISAGAVVVGGIAGPIVVAFLRGWRGDDWWRHGTGFFGILAVILTVAVAAQVMSGDRGFRGGLLEWFGLMLRLVAGLGAAVSAVIVGSWVLFAGEFRPESSERPPP